MLSRLICDCCAGQTHRKTTEGKLCSGAYVHDSTAFTVRVVQAKSDFMGDVALSLCLFVNCVTHKDCTTAKNPEGISGREWCYIEVCLLILFVTSKAKLCAVCSIQEQVASGSPQTWARLATAMRVSQAYEFAHAMPGLLCT